MEMDKDVLCLACDHDEYACCGRTRRDCYQRGLTTCRIYAEGGVRPVLSRACRTFVLADFERLVEEDEAMEIAMAKKKRYRDDWKKLEPGMKAIREHHIVTGLARLMKTSTEEYERGVFFISKKLNK